MQGSAGCTSYCNWEINSVSLHEYSWNVKTCLCMHTSVQGGRGEGGGGGGWWRVKNSMAFLNPMIIR